MSIEQSPRSRKRDHGDFDELAELGELEEPCSVPPDFLQKLAEDQRREQDTTEGLPTPPVSIGNKRDASPARSSTGDLTDAGTVTPSYRDQSPMTGTVLSSSNTNLPQASAFAVLNGSGGNAAPPPKKQKLTFQEKELKRINKEIKEKEKAEEKARKDSKSQAQAEEKARKEAERKKKEAEREEKRTAHEAEKTAKEEKRRKKEEEKQKAEEEKRKKERSQMKLGNFFNIPASASKPRAATPDSRTSMSPAPQHSNPSQAPASAASPASFTPTKPESTPYEKLFPDFFIQSGVTVAPINQFKRDLEATQALQKTIDCYLSGNKDIDVRRPLDVTELFHFCRRDLVPRGKLYIPVREIMAEFYTGNSSRPIDLTTDSQNTQIKRTGDLLRKIPLKYLRFQEDVRPPYRGTYTSRPVLGMPKLARNPLRRDLPDTNYDYDSEAEWVEDEGEDGEDLKSDGDEDEEVDDGEDLDGFLDDEADETTNSRRLVIQGDLEPISTGLCWEDRSKRSTNVKMMKYRMEFILNLKIKSIDPFSTSYWQPVPVITSMEPPRLPLNVMKNTSANVNGLLPTSNNSMKSFFVNGNDAPKASIQAQSSKPKKFLSADDLPAFKAAIVGSDLSKVGLIEVLKRQFPGRPAAVIKNTLEEVARRGRPGEKEKDKRWLLLNA